MFLFFREKLALLWHVEKICLFNGANIEKAFYYLKPDSSSTQKNLFLAAKKREFDSKGGTFSGAFF